MKRGSMKKRSASYERAIALFPVYLDSYINLGIAYAASGRPDMAIETYTKALAMYPKNSTLYFNLAHAYAVSGQPDRAVENYLKIDTVRPIQQQGLSRISALYMRDSGGLTTP